MSYSRQISHLRLPERYSSTSCCLNSSVYLRGFRRCFCSVIKSAPSCIYYRLYDLKKSVQLIVTYPDQFSYDYDTYQYKDTVEDREAQVANITEDIRNGNTGYLNDFLNAVISEGVREGITDIFGEGVEIDDSEAVQSARRAKELLDKLAEYKPLAKIEELEEQNYNMIDNVLNNGAEKKEQEQTKGRISIKEKLAEKKAVIEQRNKAERTSPEKETEKKSQREM